MKDKMERAMQHAMNKNIGPVRTDSKSPSIEEAKCSFKMNDGNYFRVIARSDGRVMISADALVPHADAADMLSTAAKFLRPTEFGFFHGSKDDDG